MEIFNIFIILLCCFCFFFIFCGSSYYYNLKKIKITNTQLSTNIIETRTYNFSKIITSSEGIKSLGILVNLNTIKLLYRYLGSSLSISDFHNACDNKGSTLLIIQTSTGAIGLGYVSVSWDGTSGYKAAPTGSCWLCQFQISDTSIPNITLYKNYINIHWSIFCNASSGPMIGNGDVAINSSRDRFAYWTETPPCGGMVYLVPNGLFNLGNQFQSFTLKAIEVFSATSNTNI